MCYCADGVSDGSVLYKDSLGGGIAMPNWVWNRVTVSGSEPIYDDCPKREEQADADISTNS